MTKKNEMSARALEKEELENVNGGLLIKINKPMIGGQNSPKIGQPK